MSDFSKEQVERIVADAHHFTAAHERRSPTARFATLSEHETLFALYWDLKQMFQPSEKKAAA